MIVNCITLHQPWATLIAEGVKIHETRSWRAWDRLIGQPLAIHAGLRPVRPMEVDPDLCRYVRERWGPDWALHLPRGVVVAIGRIMSCEQMPAAQPASKFDLMAGDWAQGRWAWKLDQVCRFAVPPVRRGRQGIWTTELKWAFDKNPNWIVER